MAHKKMHETNFFPIAAVAALILSFAFFNASDNNITGMAVSSVEICKDTDSFNPLIEGRVFENNEVKRDYCINDDVVVENFCSGSIRISCSEYASHFYDNLKCCDGKCTADEYC